MVVLYDWRCCTPLLGRIVQLCKKCWAIVTLCGRLQESRSLHLLRRCLYEVKHVVGGRSITCFACTLHLPRCPYPARQERTASGQQFSEVFRNMGQKLSRPKTFTIDERYCRPQGLYTETDVDLRKLKKLILDRKLAPCWLGRAEDGLEVRACTVQAPVGPDASSPATCRLATPEQQFSRSPPEIL